MKKLNTKMNVAKKYEDKLESIEKDLDGLWAYSVDGWKFESMDAHTAHEFNQKDLYKVIQTLVPCDCNHCQKAAEDQEEQAEEVAEQEDFSATMRPAGKKFKYEVDVNGRKDGRLAAKGEYTHILIVKPMDVKENENLRMRDWHVYSYHKSYDLAMKAAAAAGPKSKPSKWIHYPMHTRIIEVKFL